MRTHSWSAATGALILVPRLLRADALLRVINQETGQAALMPRRVLLRRGAPRPVQVSIEILGVAAHFWGPPYEGAFASDASTPRPS